MAAMKSKQFEEEAAVKVHRIRITLTSRNVKNLEKGACCDGSRLLPARSAPAEAHVPVPNRSLR
jgi:hypothetical protein